MRLQIKVCRNLINRIEQNIIHGDASVAEVRRSFQRNDIREVFICLFQYKGAVSIDYYLIDEFAFQKRMYNMMEQGLACKIPIVFSRDTLAGMAHWYNRYYFITHIEFIILLILWMNR